MHRGLRSIVLVVFFAALIATPMVIRRLSERRAASGVPTQHDTVMARYGFSLQEVARAVGNG